MREREDPGASDKIVQKHYRKHQPPPSRPVINGLTQVGRALLGSMIGSFLVVVLVGPVWSAAGIDPGWTLRRVLFAWTALLGSVTVVVMYARRA